MENITGLANSVGQAKADWILEKLAEGYNDIYFVDDAYQNVEVVQNDLSQLDVKSKVVQAGIKFSKEASNEFNDMIERKKGMPSEQIISEAEAKKRGKGVGKWRIKKKPQEGSKKSYIDFDFLRSDNQIDYMNPNIGDKIILIGDKVDQDEDSLLSGSEYQKIIDGKLSGSPQIDLKKESSLQSSLLEIIDNKLINSAHDISSGGISTAIAESCILGEIGSTVILNGTNKKSIYFGENRTAVIVSCSPKNIKKIIKSTIYFS